MLLNCGVFWKSGAPRRTIFHAQGPNVGEGGANNRAAVLTSPLGGERAGAGGLRWFPPGLSGKGCDLPGTSTLGAWVVTRR